MRYGRAAVVAQTTGIGQLRDAGLVTQLVRAPTGTVTFAFSDVEGSTRLWAEQGESMGVALSIHDALVNEISARSGGYVFSTAGDSFGVAFDRPASAVSWALAVQERLGATDWPEGVEIRVRMGLHTGEADERGGDYFGSNVNLAARIEAAGHGTQILVSAVTAALLDRDDLVELGSFRLKDVVALQPIFQIGDREHPPLRTLDSVAGNLPRQLNGLIGRESELVDLDAIVRAHALTTLVGPGGIGKTRLALEAARRLEPETVDGVWVLELAAIGSPDDVARVAVDVLGVRQDAAGSLADQVVGHLQDRSVLLVIDNCEHVVDGVAAFAHIVLARCPKVRILATSREGLGLSAEQLVSVGPLDAAQAGTELFAERARSVDSLFDLEAWREPVEEVCRRLDGVPLAIELAAARIRTLSPSDLAARLDDRFKLLTGGRRGSVERHRTLRETVAWSFDLLEPDEQLVFARLSVFVDVFDVRAVEAVASDERLDDIDVVDLLDTLVDRSMVTTESGPFGRRFRLLETLRQFAAEQLSDTNEAGDVAARHAQWFSNEVARVGELLAGRDEIVGVARLDELWANVRAAQTWACEQRHADLAASFLKPIALELYWRGRSELTQWAERVLAIPGMVDHPRAVRCAGLAAGGYRWAQDRAGLESIDDRYGHLDRTTIDFQRVLLEQRWEDVMTAGEATALLWEEAGDHYLAQCTRFMAQSALLRLGRVPEYLKSMAGVATEADGLGQLSISRLAREGQALAAAVSGDHQGLTDMLAEAAAIETPPGTLTVVPLFGAFEVFGRGGQTKALNMMRETIRGFIEADAMFYAWLASGYFAAMMTRLDRTPNVARAVGFFETATSDIQGVRPLIAEADSYLASHRDETTRLEIKRGVRMSHLEALTYMADALDDVISGR